MATQAPPDQAPADDRGQVSPDQLDRLLTLIRPRLWIVLAALLVLVVLAVVWGFVGTVRETVSAHGIIQRGGGLQDVQSPATGDVAEVHATLGSTVSQDDPLATIEGDDGSRAVIRAPFDAVVIDVAVDESAIVSRSERLFGLEPSEGPLHAIVAVPVDRRGEVVAGRPVQVHLDDVVDSELGFIAGEVAKIDPYPAREDELNRVFGSERLAREVTGSPAVYLVRVRLLEDASTRSGLAWSSRIAADAPVDVGQLVDARIVVSEGSLVDRVFP